MYCTHGASSPILDQPMADGSTSALEHAVNLRLKIFFRISAYYSTLVILLVVITSFFPHWLQYLPVGGLSTLEHSNQSDFAAAIGEVVRTIRSPGDVFDDSLKLATAMVGSILLMLPIRWVYMSVGLNYSYNHAVAASLIILPIIVTGIVVIVQFSLALAFSLAGIVYTKQKCQKVLCQ